MATRNPNIAKLHSAYLFIEIARRRKAFTESNPGAKIISLGIGDTTHPLTPHISNEMSKAILAMQTKEGYTGYGDDRGVFELRKKISEVFYNGKVSPEEMFISDGAKCDIGRLQLMFGKNSSVAVQDPTYPAYVDNAVISGSTGGYNFDAKQFNGITYMPCTPENNFFPDINKIAKSGLIYICSPNNPTGAVATHKQLKDIVNFAKKNKSIIIFDSAYREFIQDKSLPKSIYEIEGAKEVAIEICSFSKLIGFTGVRLGWSIVPKELIYDDNTQVFADWSRIMTTTFNGASIISQHGGIASLDPEGLAEMNYLIKYYMDNAALIKSTLNNLGIKNYGGTNAPYIWAKFPGNDSWKTFDKILNEAHVITTPGVGFGPCGEGFVRFSAFADKDNVVEACKRLSKLYPKK
jgi:LL-diaminopimelate aminotransferase